MMVRKCIFVIMIMLITVGYHLNNLIYQLLGMFRPQFLGIKNYILVVRKFTPTGVYVKPDGTKFYIVGSSGDEVNEYSMSTPYDVSTGTYVQNFSVSAQDTVPNGVEFKPDGTKFYIVGDTGNDINEYDLSTPWDISTATFAQASSVSGEETSPTEVRFKSDGTKMFVTGFSGDDVNEYSLSTPWDISTASYVQRLSTGDSTQYGLTFATDGTKMYTCGATLDYIKEWNLSTPWDLSTATFHQNSGELMTNPYSLFLANTNVGVATTAVTGTRGALGISTSSHGVGDNVDAYYLSQTTVLDEAGSGSIDSVTTTLSLDTSSGITTGSGKYLSIDNELISLSGASITDNTISNVTRGQLGTASTTHLDEAEVKYLVEYTGVATIHTAIGTGVTTILITTSEDLSSKINTGGFIKITAPIAIKSNKF